MCIGQLFLTSADSESFAYLVKLLFALRHLGDYVFACAHTFVYIVLLIENGVDCEMENCRPNNVDREEREKEGESDRNTR